MDAVRHAMVWTYRILVALFTVVVVVEFFLAGLGVFRAMPGDEGSIAHDAFDDKFEVHADLGGILILLALLLVVAALVAWTGPRSIGATFGLLVLTVVQMILAGAGEDAPVSGAFHVVNALVILGLSSFLTLGAWRGSLLVPPSQIREGAPAARSVP